MKLKITQNKKLYFNAMLSMIGQAPLVINSSKFKEDAIAKPFVKWVGGKRSLIKELQSRLPSVYNNYYEPFIGGGALFFSLVPGKAIISDKNLELIIAYKVVKDEAKRLIELLAEHKINHSQTYYYDIRMNENNDNPVEIAA